MPDRRHDAAFSELVAAHRGELLGVAYLVFGSQSRAEDVVGVSLAWLYDHWPGEGSARVAALRRVVLADPSAAPAPWQDRERVELIDAVTETASPQPAVVSELAELSASHRRVVVLEHFVGLGPTETGRVLGVTEGQVELWSVEAAAQLAHTGERPAGPRGLADELRAAIPFRTSPAGPETVADDLAHGRLWGRRRRRRHVLLAATALLVVILGLTQVVPALRPSESAAESAAGPAASSTDPTPRPVPPACDVDQSSCRASLVRAWRSEMSRVAGSYVDPERRYFSGYTFSYDPLYDSSAFWNGGGGALGLDLFRLREGSTEIYLQIASSEQFAIQCGRLTGRSCDVMRFMDGNVFTLSDSTRLSDGLEVQYSPNGDQVITVVARNRSRGQELDVTRAELIELVQDPRLRLPQV